MSAHPSKTGPDVLTLDRILSLLSSERRRLVLDFFTTTAEETASLRTLVEYVSSQSDTSTAQSREQVRARLYHTDLPKIAAAGIIDYDVRSGMLRYRGVPDVVDADEWRELITAWETETGC